ncbi:protein kinase [Nonomuraea sp. NN258]|uniref:WD40 repeat domain-containing serine/threonine protein kinase n=1 Tax=Nonomuraea antri TaxID=2730852 RepID=UPI001567CAD0|nr:WD40 repeat domain-containing serine/threonine protein kinase [Nonomuraea antri]NRQ39507.1 protein kinase [Nonomuraea antri]
MPSFAPLTPGDPQSLGGLGLLGRLGEGGQGVVYLAKDHSGTHVAVKWLRPEQSGDQVSIERFLREVQVAQQVAPFCTAAVLGTGLEQDRPYIISEFIEGSSLQRVVQEEGPRSGSTLHRLAIGTATALAAIHQAGIVHRDFKPANVILGADGPRVIDFGIARALNATSTISGMVVGTPAYMPPEQIMGHTVGSAADMFAWAATMVFAASGRAPFGSDTMPAVINRVLNQQPDLGALDGQLRDVVAACLTKDPALRPTAEQVIMRLLQNPVPNSGMLAQAAAAAGAAPPQGPPPQTHPGPPAAHGGPSLTGHPGPPAGHTGPQGHAGPHTGHPAHSGPHTGHSGPHTGHPGPHTGQPWAQPQPQQQHQQPQHQPQQQQHLPPPLYAQPTHPSGYGATPPARKSRTPLIVGVTVACALLVLAGIIVVIQLDKPSVDDPPPVAQTDSLVTREPNQTTSAPPSTTPPSTTPPSTPPVPRTGTKRTLPGGAISLFENPADPITLTSYEIYDKKKDDWIDYARGSLRGTFTKYAGNWESMVSPDGRYLASRGRSYSSDGYDFIVIADRNTGARSTIKTVKKPLISTIRAWSRDGSKILLNIEKKVGNDWIYPGVAVVDVAAEKARVITIKDSQVQSTAFGWDGDMQGVVNVVGKNKGVRFFDASGKATHTAQNVGPLPAGTQDIFSPSGKQFLSDCPGEDEIDTCVWDSKSGERLRKFTSECDKVLGWYNESHLFCWEQDIGDKDEIQVVDLNGKLLRKLLEVPDNIDFSPVFTIKPGAGS